MFWCIGFFVARWVMVFLWFLAVFVWFGGFSSVFWFFWGLLCGLFVVDFFWVCFVLW